MCIYTSTNAHTESKPSYKHVFVKEKFEHLVQAIPNKNEDTIWIKIEKEFCGETDDIFIGTFYVSPAKNEKDSKWFFCGFKGRNKLL